ncbi:hypothetical protein BN1708_005978 [Verticillium longisporum]|uniref:Vacuolar import/degradation Vid27 C-terminal domain-containing protein n=1 Tax=Verticillium longisporum TaxID=100787 RepID=A0A0G4MFQ0_VERLO|nr:hypothetical protein BN1708_005978 [Verticillium longisporum]
MFVLRNVGKLIFGSTSQESLIELPQGQLYLVRPLSPKGYSELIFKDATAQIRRTGQDFQYQLVIQRVYEEGEAELLAEEEGEDAEIDALSAERDEKTFLLDEALHFRVEIREGSEKVIAWRDLSGDTGDVFEFVCDNSVSTAQAESFERIAKECQYERKYRKPHTTASNDDFRQFEFHDEPAIPPASPLHSPVLTRSIEPSDSMFRTSRNSANTAAQREQTPPPAAEKAKKEPGPPAFCAEAPEALTTYAAENAELHFYDFVSGSFVQQDASVVAIVTEVGKWQYWLQVEGKDRDWLGIPIVADINPVFNFEFLSFIFNQFTPDGSAYSWLLRFKDQPTLERFQEGLLRCLWEQLNETKWEKIKEREQEYVTDAFNDLQMEDTPEEEEEEEEEAEEPEYEDADPGQQSEHYDSDEEDEDVVTKDEDGNVNSQLAVGYKHDRSFVVRGSKIGVTFAPENKYAQMTHEPTFLGVSHNALYRIDPRLSGDKLVESQLKQYASKNQFSAMATTEKGHIAVASNKGDVRLFDRLGINAKTHIPALGEAIIGLDVSADGRWVLATCNTYILLIDAMQKTGKNEGKLGFEKPFAAADKPQPRRLALTPEHVAQFSHETGKPVRFTPARFNAGEGVEETSIITATGPYIIEWNLKKVLRGAKAPYLIKRYTEDVKADDFQFGTDKNVIVALPNEVNMIGKGGLKRPTRESIAGDFARLRVSGGRKSSGRIGTPRSGRYKLGRDEVVNSPY